MKCIEILKKRLSVKNTVFIQNECGYFEEVIVEWNSPLKYEEISKFENDNNITLPDTYKCFLQVSNGAVLFKDMKYGQWGCKILGLNELINKTNKIRDIGYSIKSSWLVFAEWLGDGDILLFDLDKMLQTNKGYIVDGDEGYNVDKWKYLNGNFENWLDRLIVSQGSKYWRW